MDFLKLVSAARTCRRFHEDMPLPTGTLEWLISCARVVPSGGNKQILRFAVVEAPETRKALFPALRWAAYLPDWNGPKEDERPTGYIAILAEAGKRDQILSIDLGITAQTIQLAAMSRNVGCCMFMSFDPHLVRQVLDIPERLDPVLMLALGVPKEERHIEPVPEDGSIKYWRDAQGGHHVPKRSLQELILIKK